MKYSQFDPDLVPAEVRSFEPGLIYGKLIQAALLMEGVEKGGRNTAQNFSFRGIEQLTKACAPIFKEVGIVVVPSMRVISSEPHLSRDGKPAGYRVMLAATYRFYAEDGSFVEATTIGEGVDSYDKATNKAMSAAFKYALLQTLCIGDPEDDGDAHGAPAEPAPQRARARKAAAPKAPTPPEPPAAAEADDASNEVGPKDWGTWRATRDMLIADDGLKDEFAAWCKEQPFKIERSISKANFDLVVAKAEELRGRAPAQ